MAYITNTVSNTTGNSSINNAYKYKDIQYNGNSNQITTTGKNYIPTQYYLWEQGTINGSTGANQSNTARIRTIDYYPITPGTYYASLRSSNYGWINIEFYKSDKTFISAHGGISNVQEAQITVPANTAYFRAIIRNKIGNDILPNNVLEAMPQIELGASQTSFEQYSGVLASPSSSCFQNINNITGLNTIKITGKNLISLPDKTTESNGLIGTWNGNTITINGTNEKTDANWAFMQTTNMSAIELPNFQAGETYTISIDQPTQTQMFYLQLNYYKNGATSESKLVQYNSNYSSAVFTIPNDFYKVNKFYVGVYKTTTATNVSFNVQIEKSMVSSDYEAYKSKTFDIDFGARNLFNINDITEHLLIKEDGTTNPSSTTSSSSNYIQVYPNAIYTESFVCNYNGAVFRVHLYDKDKNWIRQSTSYTATSTTNRQKFSFTTTADTKYVRITFRDTTNESQNAKDIQIEIGENATSYTSFGVEPIELCQVGDNQDNVQKENGIWYKNSKIKRLVLKGTENWNTQATSDDYLYFYTSDYDSDINNEYNCLCDSFAVRTSKMTKTTSVSTDTIVIGGSESSKIRVKILASALSGSTTTNFKTWLSNNNVVIYYILKTEEKTQITDSNLIHQLNAIELYNGTNYIDFNNQLFQYTVLNYYTNANPYLEKIYSQDDKNKLKIWFNDVELENADVLCEKITRTARVLPNDGNQIFMLDNFIATSLDVILHNVDVDTIQDQVKISIGTDVGNNTYQYIPLGVFNIQDTPEKDGNKVTLKLRDNRVKFDFPYDASPLMESQGGTATKKQIFDDICDKAGVGTTIETFNGANDEVGVFDNSILGSTYISYLMEQAGLTPYIDRNGLLSKIDFDDLYTWRIPLSIVESYTIGTPYQIERVCYESGIIKYETSDDETLDTLYIDGANPYLTNVDQVNYILSKLENFEIDSATTKKVLGNPAIDPFDLIEVYNDLDGTDDTVFTTLANTSYTYNGVHRDIFDTQIGKEKRKENVTIRSDASKFKKVYTEIDNVRGEITLFTSEITTAQTTADNALTGVNSINSNLQNYYTVEQTNQLVQNAQSGLTNTFQTTGGANIFRNTGLWFETNDANNPYEFWNGKVTKTSEYNAVNRNALILQEDTLEQQEDVPNGIYTVSFNYQKLINLADVKVVINGTEYSLTSTSDTEFEQTLNVTSQYINIKFISDSDNACKVYNLMVNYGQKMAYSQNQNETTTDTVNISKGITITSSDTNTKFKADSDGTRILNAGTNEIKAEFTDKGVRTDELEANKATLAGLLIQDVDGQTWLSRV